MVSAFAAGAVVAAEPGEPAPFPEPLAMRVETTLYDTDDKPVAHALTVFHKGVAWDFLKLPPTNTSGKARKDTGATMTLVEIVLHDPARERVVVIDPVRGVKTEVATVRLDRLGASLAAWARQSDDRLVQWAGGPDFTEGFHEEQGAIELAGPRARYAVKHAVASSPDEARSYRRFADTAIMLKALLQPGGMPPFPRLAINRKLEEAGAIPTEVTLEIEPRGMSLSGPLRFRGEHHAHPRVLADDLDRIAEGEAAMGAAVSVELAEFADHAAVVK
jgi:hypothetical protein